MLFATYYTTYHTIKVFIYVVCLKNTILTMPIILICFIFSNFQIIRCFSWISICFTFQIFIMSVARMLICFIFSDLDNVSECGWRRGGRYRNHRYYRERDKICILWMILNQKYNLWEPGLQLKISQIIKMLNIFFLRGGEFKKMFNS